MSNGNFSVPVTHRSITNPRGASLARPELWVNGNSKPMNPIPLDVTEWIRKVFRECNERIAEKLSNNPNIPEESLDLTWIEHLSQFSSPVTLGSSWTVKIETHYLGGLRHWRTWEIADIGMLVFFRRAGTITRSKVALLQSKRLYPSNNTVQEEDRVDYEIGFARLADPEKLQQAVAVQAEFHFDEACRYGALAAKSQQVLSISEYEKVNKTPVYYQLYNPWRVPFTQRIPLSQFRRPSGDLELGTRIIPAKALHDLLATYGANKKPALSEVKDLCPDSQFGWTLEHFIADLLVGCVEGSVFDNISEPRIQGLFYRRSGPISAAIAVSIEAPE
jgi:hypothetical protein